MKIDFSLIRKHPGGTPLYRQLAELIRSAIRSGVYRQGEQIESVREIMRAAGISQLVVTQAFDELRDAGLINGQVGSGTFVCRSLPKKKPTLRTVALLYYATSTPMYKNILIGVESVCKPVGVRVVPIATGLQQVNAGEIMKLLRAEKIEGLLCLAFGSLELARLVDELCSSDFPVVMLGAHYQSIDCSAVTFDNEQGGFLIGRHLLEFGHRRLVYLNMQQRYPYNLTSIEIRRGLQRSLEETNTAVATIEEIALPTGLPECDSGYRDTVAALFQKAPPPTALICYADGLARVVYRVLRDLGMRIPDDVSVTGFGNLLTGDELDPALTTIAWPLSRVGKAGAELILEYNRESASLKVLKVFDTVLVVRKSTGNEHF